MIRATLDVNVLASAFPETSGTPAELIARWANQEYELVLSDHILAGLLRAWQKPYFRLRYPPQLADAAVRLLRTNANIVLPDMDVRAVAQDEEDDLVLATAIAGDVDYLVTGDKLLQALDEFPGVAILSPRAFLAVLDRESRRTS